jgi:hypothetical protein
MTGPRAWAALGAATLVLCACGKAGGGAASGQSAASSAPPAVSSAAAAPSDTAVSSAAASALPPAAASAPAPTVRPAAAAAPAPPRREPTAAELLHDDPRYIARAHRIDQLYGNARERDPTGQVDHEQAAAMAELHACVDKACLDAWMSRREAALSQYVGN